jgi:hypothetical protein
MTEHKVGTREEWLAARNQLLEMCISRAPLETLRAYKARMAWSFPWASSQGRLQPRLPGLGDEGAGGAVSRTRHPPVVAQMAADCGTDPAGYMTEPQALSAFALSEGVV